MSTQLRDTRDFAYKWASPVTHFFISHLGIYHEYLKKGKELSIEIQRNEVRKKSLIHVPMKLQHKRAERKLSVLNMHGGHSIDGRKDNFSDELTQATEEKGFCQITFQKVMMTLEIRGLFYFWAWSFRLCRILFWIVDLVMAL